MFYGEDDKLQDFWGSKFEGNLKNISQHRKKTPAKPQKMDPLDPQDEKEEMEEEEKEELEEKKANC